MSADPPAADNESFEIVSVQRAEPPPGSEGTEWHTYVITQGHNTIYGCRQGSHSAVRSEVEAIVVRLNERRLHKSGRTHLISRGRKPGRAAAKDADPSPLEAPGEDFES